MGRICLLGSFHRQKSTHVGTAGEMSLFCDVATGLAASFLSRRGKPSSSLERALRLVMMMRNGGVWVLVGAAIVELKERVRRERDGWREKMFLRAQIMSPSGISVSSPPDQYCVIRMASHLFQSADFVFRGDALRPRLAHGTCTRARRFFSAARNFDLFW